MLARLRWPPESDATGDVGVVLEAELARARCADPAGPLAGRRRSAGPAARRRSGACGSRPSWPCSTSSWGTKAIWSRPPFGEVVPVEPEAALVEGEAAGQRPGERGLAGAGGADDGDEPAPLDAEGDVVEQDPPARRVRGDADHLEEGFRSGPKRTAGVTASGTARDTVGGGRHPTNIEQSAAGVNGPSGPFRPTEVRGMDCPGRASAALDRRSPDVSGHSTALTGPPLPPTGGAPHCHMPPRSWPLPRTLQRQPQSEGPCPQHRATRH